MSSLFNYELDEKNIRSTLQNAGQNSYYEDAWRDFELNYCRDIHKPASTAFFKLPEINLNINRSVILPAVFILALVGLSAILLNFIDFKSDKDQQVERKLEPNPNNFKQTVIPQQKENKQASTVVAQKTETVIKKDTVKMVTATLPPASSNVVKANSQVVPATTTAVVNTTVKTPGTIATPAVSQAITVNTSSVVPTRHRMRRKKTEAVPSEQIETIKAPALIKTESESPNPEPDLEIKVD